MVVVAMYGGDGLVIMRYAICDVSSPSRDISAAPHARPNPKVWLLAWMNVELQRAAQSPALLFTRVRSVDDSSVGIRDVLKDNMTAARCSGEHRRNCPSSRGWSRCKIESR